MDTKFSLTELLKNPLAQLASAYFFILLALVGLGFFYINQNPAIMQNKVPAVVKDTTNLIVPLVVQEPRINPGIDLKLLTVPDQALLDKGKQLYDANCASCHGSTGSGDGVAGAVMNPKPRNFRLEAGWKNGRKVSEIYYTLQSGLIATGMPAYDYLAPYDRIAMIKYLRTFMTNAPVDTEFDITSLDQTYLLTQGAKVAGTIPVDAAIRLMATENSAKLQKITEVLDLLNRTKIENDNAKLFFKITNNQKNAVTTLLNSNKWMNSHNDFISLVSSYMISNGFNGKIVELSDEKSVQLFQYLKSILM